MLASPRGRRSLAVALALVVTTPSHLLAVPAAAHAEASQADVRLAQGGVLRGYVVDGSGLPVGNAEVQLRSPDGQLVTTRSDAEGRFGYRGLAGGTYQLETKFGAVACRTWTEQAAPPTSASTLLVVHDEQLARGQWGPPPAANSFVTNMKHTLTHPFAVAAIIGAAVAIPVAIHNSNQDDSGS